MKGLKLASYLFMGLALVARCTLAVDCSLPSPGFPISNGAGFNLLSSTFTVDELKAARAPWSSCGYYGSEMPSLWVGGSGGIPVTITRVPGLSTEPSGGCGQSAVQPSNGQVVSATITVWTHQANGVPCAPLSDVITHELGHVYGLGDNGSLDCLGHVMGRRNAGGTRVVYADDCDMADDMWEVPNESYYDPNCDAFCTQGCVNGQCPTPIVVDLDGNGFHLLGPDEPVAFDIDADGVEEMTSWTSPDQKDGFLALDRNGNGLIDDATELFGNSTPLEGGGTAYNGYIPLRELDGLALGGNGDGYLDQRDAIFGSLLVWLDLNHNGISEALEISTLEQAGVIRLALEYTTNKRRDRHGNQLRFQSKAWVRSAGGRERLIHTVDVVFRESGM